MMCFAKSVSSFLLIVACFCASSPFNKVIAGNSEFGFFSLFKDKSFINQDGQVFTAPVEQSHLSLVNFVFTDCTTVCPVQTAQLVRVMDGLPESVRARVGFVSVSLQPAVDTPSKLRQFSARLGAVAENWQFVVSEPSETQALINDLQLLADDDSGNPDNHITDLWLVNAEGLLVRRYSGSAVDVPGLIQEIQALSSLQQ